MNSRERFMRLTLPDEGWALVLYEAYLDETGGGDGGFSTTGVAGYVIRAEAVASFEKQWLEAISPLPFIHMKDFAPGSDIYASLGRDERAAMGVRLIQIIRDHVEIAVGAFAPEARFEKEQGDEPYSFCLQHSALILDYLLSRKHGSNYEASIYFERGRKHSDRAVRFFEERDDPRIQRFGSVRKEDSGLIQAADMITWHIAKYMKDAVSEARKPRRDFASLMDIPGEFCHIFPYQNGILMAQFFNDGVLDPRTIEKVRDMYNPSIPMEDIFSKYGAAKISSS